MDTNTACSLSPPDQCVWVPWLYGHILVLSMLLPTHHIPTHFTTNVVGAKGRASSNFATFSAQLRALLLRKWLEEPRGTLLILPAHVIVIITLTTEWGADIARGLSLSLALWTVRSQVLLLMLKQGCEYAHQCIHSFMYLFNNPFSKFWAMRYKDKRIMLAFQKLTSQ